jgi:RNA polymerase sigma-32 factor
MTTQALVRLDSFERYMSEVNRIPLLSRAEEEAISQRFAESGDPELAQQLVMSNLRFVVKIANEYRGYGLKLLDLVQEGNMGLMVAVQKFEPERGYRLISYGVWWIRAYIQAYVMRSYSLVKMGTTQAQRRLFFGRRKAIEKLNAKGSEPTRENIAEMLDVSPRDVGEMEVRMAGHDFSLDAPLFDDGGTLLEQLPSPAASPEDEVVEVRFRRARSQVIREALEVLDPRERMIIEARDLAESPRTLTDLGAELGVSRERARQLQARGLQKLRTFLLDRGDEALLPT